jgi:hypothetical protein
MSWQMETLYRRWVAWKSREKRSGLRMEAAFIYPLPLSSGPLT